MGSFTEVLLFRLIQVWIASIGGIWQVNYTLMACLLEYAETTKHKVAVIKSESEAAAGGNRGDEKTNKIAKQLSSKQI